MKSKKDQEESHDTVQRNLVKNSLQAMKGDLEKQFEEVKAKGLNLDMSRGKPCKEQLNLSMGMLEELKSTDKLKCETGIDCRNYGLLEGIPEARRLLGENDGGLLRSISSFSEIPV